MSDPKPVEAIDPAKKSSQITDPVNNDATVLTTSADLKCYWNDEELSLTIVLVQRGKVTSAAMACGLK